MRVIVISLRNLIIGGAIFLLVLITGIVLLLSDPLDVSQSYQWDADSEAVPASAGAELYGSPKPTLTLDVDVNGNEAHVKMLTQNFRFVGSDSSESPQPAHGEGHAHLYLDGKFWQMLYGPEFKIKQLPEGEHEIRVELNYSNHLPYKVEAVKIIQVD
ncbi:MAG: hypothetical protein H0Z34_04370 [Brevibacillus sp.]|nr:hypothetical protein [Brevibacillus sp.]